MEEDIKRLVKNCFPELTAGHHLPRFAQVINARQNPTGGELHDDFKPVFAVDLQVLTEHGEPDPAYPQLHDVPLPVSQAGHDSGSYSFPENGTWVEVGFAYGSPNKPFIRCILPHGRSLMPVERGEQRIQNNPASYQRIDKDGNHERQTDMAISDKSLKRLVEALENIERYTTSMREVAADDTEAVGGSKTIKAHGLINFLSGGRFDLAALADFHITGMTFQRFKAPKTWIGSQDENVLRQLSELMQLVIDLCNILKNHTHSGVQAGGSNTAAPVQSGTINTVGTDTGAVKTRLDGIKE